MQYSEYEIISAYKGAKLKGKQLSILADMNCCTQAQMRQYLLEHGIPEEELPKKPGRKIKQTEEKISCGRSVCHGVPVAEQVSEPDGSHNKLPEIVKTALKHEEQSISRDISQTEAKLSQKKIMLKLRQDEYERLGQDIEEIGKTIDRLTEEHKEKTEALNELQSILNA